MRKISCLLVLAISIASLTLSPLFEAAAYSQANALTYLQANANSAWATMGLAALGSQNIPSDYLKNISATKATDLEAPILAITALNQDPRTFGLTNYITGLENFHTSGQIGDPGLLNDDFWGIMALVSAGVPVSNNAITDSKAFILANQNSNGGWGYAPGTGSDSDDTAAAITALISAGMPASDSHIVSALAYIKALQNSDGGFPSDPSFDTLSNSSSTSWVIWALKAAGIDQSTWAKGSNTPADFVSSYQIADGSFKWEAADTVTYPATAASAVIALEGKTLPLNRISQTLTTVSFRIEGSSANVCSGTVAAQTAMDIIKNAAASCGYTFNINSGSLGQYLTQINSDAASGAIGWLYLVNNAFPSVGAANYQIQNGDTVLWYFGAEGLKPLKLDLSSDAVNSGQSAKATVQDFSSGSYSPLSGALVYFGSASSATDASGQASLAPQDGYYKIFAQKDGYIRSNTATLKVGEPSSSGVSLNATFTGGRVEGTSTVPSVISFTVDSSSLDFGAVSPGSQKTKTLKVTNTGSLNIALAAAVSGDPLFTNNLSLNNKFWRNFSSALTGSQSLNLTAGLNVPAGFSGTSGAKSGQLIIWASAQ